jgi:hypothetical protein
MINSNEQAHKEGYEALLAISAKYGIDVVTVLDDDIFNAIKMAKENGVENADELLAKLTPEVCKNIRDDFIERLCEHWADCLEDAINNQINSGDEEDDDAVNTEADTDADVDSEADSEGNEVKDA